nr:cytochrome c biogenesis protein CcsA [Desulfurococcales archaeon]
AFLNDAFTKYEAEGPGAGFNPLLKTAWVYPHPLSTFTGYAMLAVASIALYLSPGDLRSYRLFVAGWAVTTLGIVLGGIWSYDTFGWGGYWAWDPVETGELLVWLSGALVIHLRGPMARFRGPASLIAVSSILLALYVTRTGLSPLHGFALPNVGAVILLSASLFFLAWFLRDFTLLWDKPGPSFRGLSLENLGFTVASISLMTATFFVYGSLLTPSILTAVGMEASVPQWDSGVRYFNPPLYLLALAMILSMPASLAGRLLGWRGYLAFVSASLAVALVALASSKGLPRLAPLSSQATNYMIVAGLSIALLTLSLLLAVTAYQVYYSRLRALRQALLNAVHAGLVVLFVGVLVSGSISYGRQYAMEFYVSPGEEIEVAGDFSLRLEGFQYRLQEGYIDVYTPYAGNSKGYMLAWTALREVTGSLQRLADSYREGVELLSNETLLKQVIDAAGLNETLDLETLDLGVASEILVSPYSNGSSVYLNGSPVELVNATIYFEVVIINPERIPPDTGIAIAVNASKIIIRPPSPVTGLDPGSYSITLSLEETVEVESTAAGSPIRVRIDAIALSSLNATLLDGGSTVVFTNLTGTIIGSLASGGGEALEAPIILVGPASAYYHVNYGSLSWVRDFIGDGGVLLDGYSLLGAQLDPSPGFIRVPRVVPEGAYLDVGLSAVVGGEEYSAVARLRFDANGELLGIRGLVPQVIHIWRGLSDIYIVVYPPIAEAGDQLVHELMLYYLSEIARIYGDRAAFALASIIMAEYYPSPRGVSDLWSLARDSYYFYRESVEFSESSSRIYSDGLRVEVKIIPGVGLVWLGSLLSVAAALLLALLPPRLLYGVTNKRAGGRLEGRG